MMTGAIVCPEVKVCEGRLGIGDSPGGYHGERVEVMGWLGMGPADGLGIKWSWGAVMGDVVLVLGD